jgi:uncharacterized membrane protein
MDVRFVSPLVVVLSLSPFSALFGQTHGSAEVNSAVRHDVSQPLRNMAPKPQSQGKHQKRDHRTRTSSLAPHIASPAQAAPIVSTASGATSAPAIAQGFDGLGDGFAGPQGTFNANAAPSDANGAVGATQYVQWVNESFAIFDKATGAVLYGPAAGNTLWTGFGGLCETDNDGDPIVQYDKAAGRWIMTQHAETGAPPYYQCVAVSTTSDATGSYYRYAFAHQYLNDYAKLGVWPDGYYMTFNTFNGATFLGGKVCALDRSSMLNGAPATQQCLQSTSNTLLPADLDGATPPPAGSPNYLMDYYPNNLRLWKYHVDFANPVNTTVTGPFIIPVDLFSEACSASAGTCIPQLGTDQLLDSVGDRLMYRLAYRNFGDHEALVVNHSVDTTNAVGVRWYEIRNLSSTPTLYQQGTYAPDSNYRWMGSIAMDQSGDIALGYSLSGSMMKPAIAYTGRVPTDPLGSMGTETVVIYGTGSQLPNLSRWGDYTSMSIDPIDDCTFWYTNQYLTTDGTYNWSTRIASFRFPSCGVPVTPDFTISAAQSSSAVTQGTDTSYTVSVSSQTGFTGNVDLTVSGLPAGAASSFNPTPVASGGSSTLSITTGNSTPAGTYTLTITGTSGSLVHSTTVTLTVTPLPVDFTLNATPAKQTVNQGSGTSYTISVSPINGFSGNVALSVSGLPSGAGGSFNPASVAGSGNSTLTITTSSLTPAGTYTLTITGTSSSLAHSTTVTLAINPLPDFTLAATPGSQTVTQGANTSYTVTVSSVGGFNGNVALTLSGLPAGAGYTFNPSSVAGSGTSTLTVTTSSSTPTGTYTLTITGSSFPLRHSATITLAVIAAPDFSLAATPSSTSVIQGSGASYTVTVSSINGFTGNVGFSLSGLPTGAGYSFSPSSIAGSGTSTLSVTTSGSTPAGTYSLTITGTSGTLVHSATVNMVVAPPPDFTLTATSVSPTATQASNTSYTISLVAVNGFTGNVGFSLSGLPTGAGYSFSPSSIAGSGTSTLSVTTGTSTPAGTYSLTITGTSGTLVRSTAVTLVVNTAADFSVSATPGSRTVSPGDTTRYSITVTPGNGFNQTVNLSVSGLPYGTTAGFNPVSVNGSGTSTLKVNTRWWTARGTYTLAITGTSGGLSHTTAVTLTVQ